MLKKFQLKNTSKYLVRLLLLAGLNPMLSSQIARSEASTPTEISISVLGQSKFEGSVLDLKKILAPETIKLIEPQIEAERSYQAFDFKKLMTSLKASDWAQVKTLKITCLDGYTPVVLVSELKKGQPFLAFASADKNAFEFQKNGHPVNYGPLYLVWTQKMTAIQRKLHLNAGNWPYQISKMSFE